MKSSSADAESFLRLQHVKEDIDHFVRTGENLFLFSNGTGNGKTSWACNIGKEYIVKYAYNYADPIPVMYVSVTEFITMIKDGFSDPVIRAQALELGEKIKRANLVIWDDLATKMFSEYDMNLIYVYINHRVENMKSNIYTSNVSGVPKRTISQNGAVLETPSDLELMIGARLYDRIYGYSSVIEVKGPSYRAPKGVY